MDYTVFWLLLRQFAFLAITMNLAYCDDIRKNKLKRWELCFAIQHKWSHIYTVFMLPTFRWGKSHKQQKWTGTTWRSPRWDPWLDIRNQICTRKPHFVRTQLLQQYYPALSINSTSVHTAAVCQFALDRRFKKKIISVALQVSFYKCL